MTTFSKVIVWILMLSCALIANGWAAGPATAPAAPDPNDQEASCLLKITSDAGVFPLDQAIVQSLLSSSGVTREAVREVLGPHKDVAGVTVGFQMLGAGASVSSGGGGGGGGGFGGLPGPGLGGGAGMFDAGGGVMMAPGSMGGGGMGMGGFNPPEGRDQILVGRLTVSSPEGGARQIMAAVTKRFGNIMTSIGTEELDRLEAGVKTTARQAEEARHRIQEIQAVRHGMLEQASVSDLSRESVLEMSRKLESERQDISIRMQALQARQEAIRHQMASVTRPAAAKDAAGTDLADQRARLAELKAELDKLKATVGKDHAQVKATEEFAKQLEILASTKEQDLARVLAAGQLGGLNNQLASLSIDLTEAQVRLKTLEDKCREMRELLAKADDYELRVGIELPLAKAAYESARLRQQELETRKAAVRPPAVTVLGG